MGLGRGDGTVRRIGALYATGSLVGLGDGRLLGRFVDGSAPEREEAFATLVRRHGPMVLATCRRMLGDSAEVDDAFQAVFLVLSRKAGALTGSEDVGGWLRATAVRVGREARTRRAKLRLREGAPLDDSRAAAAVDPDLFDVLAALDEELERLPARLREAVRLCELEGMPRRDVAERLGLAEGTLSSRLARGRSLLRDRLARRGLAVGLLAAALPRASRSAPLPDAALRRALDAITVGDGPGMVSEAAASLAEGALAMLALSRWKLLARSACTLAALALGGGLALGFAAARPDDPPAQSAAPPKPRQTGAIENETARGVVVDEDGRPIVGAEVLLNAYTPRESRGVTAADGSFTVRSAEPRVDGRSLLAIGGARVGGHKYAVNATRAETAEPVRIVARTGREIVARVLDSHGEAAAGAVVEAVGERNVIAHAEADARGLARLLVPADDKVKWIVAQEPGAGFDYAEFGERFIGDAPVGVAPAELPAVVPLTLGESRTVRIKALDETGAPASGVPLAVWLLRKDGRLSTVNYWSRIHLAVTGADGVAVFDWLPRTLDTLTFFPRSLSLSHYRIDVTPDQVEPVVVRVTQNVPLRGRVALPDDSSAKDVLVRAYSSGGVSDVITAWTRTGDDGTYTMNLPSGETYLVWVEDKEWAAPPRMDVVARPGSPIRGVDFVLSKGTLIRGTVTVGPDQLPAEGRRVGFAQELGGPASARGRASSSSRSTKRFLGAMTDAEGRYSIRVSSGIYVLDAPNKGSEPLKVDGQDEIVHDIRLAKPMSRNLSGRVVDDRGEPVAGAQVHVGSRAMASDAAGRFEAEFYLARSTMFVTAASPDGERLGAALVAPEEDDVLVKMQPTARVTGVLRDEEGRPLARQILEWSGSVEGSRFGRFIGRIATDESGRFTSPPVPTGWSYRAALITSPTSRPDSRGLQIGPFPVEEPGLQDVGEVRVAAPKP